MFWLKKVLSNNLRSKKILSVLSCQKDYFANRLIISRWFLSLQEYNFVVKDIAHKDNIMADLSSHV